MTNIPRLYVFSFLKMALFPMAVITLFWKDEIGLSLTQILVLQGFFSLATLLMEYPSGYVSDRLGYRFSLVLASGLGVAGWGVYAWAESFWTVVMAEALLGISFAFVSGSDSALLFETLKQRGTEEHYARFDGRMTAWAQGGEAAGALFAGVMYAAWPRFPFVVQVGVWTAALAIALTLKETPHTLEERSRSHLAEAAAVARRALIDDRRLSSTILFATFLGIASFYPVWLIQPHMQQSGVPLAWFGPVWAGANLTVALFSFLSARTHFHLGERGMSALFLLLIGGGYLGLGLWGGTFGFLFYFLLTAMRGLQGPLLRNILQQGIERRERASILSLKSFLFRLLFVVSGPAVGFAADRIGLRPTFLLVGAVLTAALIPLRATFLKTAGRP